MGKGKFSNLELEKLLKQGMGVRAIAKKLRVSPSAVSQRLKALRVAVSAHVAVRDGGRLAEQKYNAQQQLLNISQVINKELQYIQEKIKKDPPENERAKWQEAQLKHTAEIRQQIKLMLEIASTLYRVEEVANFQKIVIEEIGNESPECRERIVKRLVTRGSLGRSVDFPIH